MLSAQSVRRFIVEKTPRAFSRPRRYRLLPNVAMVPLDPVSGCKAVGMSASGIAAAVRGPRIKALAQRSDVNTSAIGSVMVVCESRRSGAENPGSEQAYNHSPHSRRSSLAPRLALLASMDSSGAQPNKLQRQPYGELHVRIHLFNAPRARAGSGGQQ